jgi:hypothetical protein
MIVHHVYFGLVSDGIEEYKIPREYYTPFRHDNHTSHSNEACPYHTRNKTYSNGDQISSFWLVDTFGCDIWSYHMSLYSGSVYLNLHVPSRSIFSQYSNSTYLVLVGSRPAAVLVRVITPNYKSEQRGKITCASNCWTDISNCESHNPGSRNRRRSYWERI